MMLTLAIMKFDVRIHSAHSPFPSAPKADPLVFLSLRNSTCRY